MNRIILVSLATLLVTAWASAAEYHVSVRGDDGNEGSAAKPFKTISAAAQVAEPGDEITVHEGIYREQINPPRGGESDRKRIVYQAAPGEKVEIKGSEIVKGWEKVEGDVWKVVLPNSFFGGFNPYSDLIHGDWFDPKKREHHTGTVYLNGEWLMEAATLEDVSKTDGEPLWFGKVDQDSTTLWARFPGVDPNAELVEINVRQKVFYPEKPGVNYITVRGFALRQAATNWAPPTTEQMGLVGTHWSKGWIIEDNVVSHSKCTGIALGKYGEEADKIPVDSAEGFVKTVERALANGWNKETIGHHIVRNNTISHCEQAGVVGSMGAVFSTITGNTIHDIHVRRLFGGAEMAGIKIHAAIDVEIRDNHIYRVNRGLWLDWMAQGTRVSRNLFHDNTGEDLYVEVNHGPFVVDNNLFLSRTSLRIWSHSGAYAHNLFAGRILPRAHDGRVTPFHKPHSTEIAGLSDVPGGDDHYYNNVFVGEADLRPYDEMKLPVWMSGNVYLKGAMPSKHETSPVVKADADPKITMVEKADGWYLEFDAGDGWGEETRELVTSKLLGTTVISGAAFEQPDGKPIRVNKDLLGKKRAKNPTPGPLEGVEGMVSVKVWDSAK